MSGSYQTLSTRDVPLRQRVEQWCAFGSETLTDMMVDPDERVPFDAKLSRVEIADVGVVWMETSAAVARRRSADVGRWAAGAGNAFLLTVQESGHSSLDHNGQTGLLLPGDMMLRSCGTAWCTRSSSRMSTVTLKLPAERVLTRIPDPGRLVGKVFGGGLAPVQMAASIMLSIKRSLADSPELSWSETVADVVLDALALACSHAAASPECHVQANLSRNLRWQEVGRFVEGRLADPQLTVGTIAAAMGMSVRSLQRLFVAEGVTASRFILDRRLERAAEILRANGGRQNLTELAFSLGFNELSYFSRSFSARFGLPPRAFQSRLHD